MTDVKLCAKGLVKRFRKHAVLSGFELELELESGSVTAPVTPFVPETNGVTCAVRDTICLGDNWCHLAARAN